MDLSAATILIPVFGVFIPALMLPGPDFVGVVRASITRGTRAGLLTAAGVTTGLGFYATLNIVGLAAILTQFHWLTVAVRVLGGCYLIYLGARLALTKATPVEINTDGYLIAIGAGRSFLLGLGITLTNPKAVVLFSAAFAPAITQQTPAWLTVVMVGLVVLSAGIWYLLVALFMSSGPVVRRFRTAQHWIERAAGVCFVTIGGRILANARSSTAT